jgi:hypothetical protein
MATVRDVALAIFIAAFVLVLALLVARDRVAAAALRMPPRLYAWLYNDYSAPTPGDRT